MQPQPSRIERGLWWDEALSLVEGCTHFMDADLKKPLSRRKPTVYAVWNDLGHAGITDAQLDKVFAVMALCPEHQFMVLTKRPERMAEYFAVDFDEEPHDERLWSHLDSYEKRWPDWSVWSVRRGRGGLPFVMPPPNVWLGTTVGHPDSSGRIGELLKCPAAVRFLSCEPLLGRIVLPSLGFTGPQTMVDWIIIGCESGPHCRPCKLEWVESLIDQAGAGDGIPVFVKQLDIDGRVSKDPAEWPEWARRREFPG